MIRGTTTPFTIKLPYAMGELEWVTIKWWQDGNKGTLTAPLPITKRLSHCIVSNIYTCELQSDIEANATCCFTIEGTLYGFNAPQMVSAGTTLKYDANTQILSIGETDVSPSVVDNSDNMTELTFVNEACYDKELHFILTAEETMRFSDKHKAKMQFRARLLSNGRIIGCTPRAITVYPINDDLLDEDVVIPEVDSEGWVIFDGGSVAT